MKLDETAWTNPMRKITKQSGIALGIAVLFGFYLTSLYSFLLFHTLTEMFGIVVACAVFLLAWNARRFLRNNYLLFVGEAYLFVGGMDLLHTLAYQGMVIFPHADPDMATQLWVGARYMESVSLLLAPLFLGRRLRPVRVFAVYTVIFAVLVASIMVWEIFPRCYVEGTGLTRFKIVSEYVICLILIAAMAMLLKHRGQFDRDVLHLLVWSIVLTIGAELSFTLYVSVYSASILVGHFFKIISFYLIYKAIIETGLRKPYELVFRELKKKQESLEEQRAALRVSQEQYRIVADFNYDWEYWIDVQGLPVYMSPSCERITGYSPADFIENLGLLLDIAHPDDREQVARHLSQACRSDEPEVHFLDFRIVDRQGRIHWIDHVCQAVAGQNGEPLGRRVSNKDITDRKSVEEALRASEGTLNTILESTPVGISMAENRRILRTNRAYKEIFGFECPEDYVGKDSRFLFVSDADYDLVGELYQGLRDGTTKGIDVKQRRKNGSTFDAYLVFRAVDPSDPTGKVICSVTDITWRKQAEEKQKQLVDELKHFTYIVSHDLRAPITNVAGFAGEIRTTLEEVGPMIERAAKVLTGEERALIKHALEEDLPESLGFIRSSVSRMDGLVNAILGLSRLGRRDLHFEALNMNELVKEILDSLAHQIEQSDLAVTVGALPEVTADRTAMEQIMGNLVDNTVKYLDPARPGKLEITGNRLNAETLIRVKDNGRGINLEDLDKVFQIFQRAGNQDVPGEGMGLAHVRTLVRRHGGQIWCESEPGVGSTFSFTISNTPGE